MARAPSIDSFLQNLFVSGAFLDTDGRIVEVSEGWRQFARSEKLVLDNYGIGQNYLKHSIFPDPSSAATLRGLKALLSRQIDVFSTIYPCDVPTGPKWFLLVGFSIDRGTKATAAVLHIDISGLLKSRTRVSALMVGVGSEALDPAIQVITRAIRKTISEGLQNSGASSATPRDSREQKIMRSLTTHQRILLSHLARGATNSEIARSQNISLGTVKNRTTALLKKLGVGNRTQAALMAVKGGILDED